MTPEDLLYTDHPYLVLMSPWVADLMVEKSSEFNMIKFVEGIPRLFGAYKNFKVSRLKHYLTILATARNVDQGKVDEAVDSVRLSVLKKMETCV